LFLSKEEIQSILDFSDRNTIPIGVVFENELFDVEESTFVVDFLSDLNERSPGVLRSESGTFGTLSSLNNVFDFEDLLKNRRSEDL